MKKVLITDHVHNRLKEGLEELEYKIDYRPEIPYLDIFDIIQNYEGIVINSKVKMTKTLIDKANNLNFIARLGSGLEIIDLEAARQKGIHVFNAPEGNRVAVAEHALGMLLALNNNLMMANFQVRNKSWNRESCRGWELEGKTIGIIGFGNNGSAFAERLTGFNCNVLVFDKYKKQFAHLYQHVREETLENVIKKSDVISFHVPLTTETQYMFDHNFLKNCKQGVIIINSSRGKVVNTEQLILGLESGKIGGACLDVFENEKTDTYSENEDTMYANLYQMKQTILSPHIAGWTQESFYKISDSLLKQITNLA